MLHSTLQKVTKQTKKVCHRYLVFLLQSYRWNRLSSLCLSFLKRSIDLARIQGRISVNLVSRVVSPSTSYTGFYSRQPRTQDLISVNLVPRILSPSTSYPGSYLRQPLTQDLISVNLVPRILSPSTLYPGYYLRQPRTQDFIRDWKNWVRGRKSVCCSYITANQKQYGISSFPSLKEFSFVAFFLKSVYWDIYIYIYL